MGKGPRLQSGGLFYFQSRPIIAFHIPGSPTPSLTVQIPPFSQSQDNHTFDIMPPVHIVDQPATIIGAHKFLNCSVMQRSSHLLGPRNIQCRTETNLLSSN